MSMAILSVVTAVAIPVSSRTTADMKLQGDARAIHNLISLAKLRASAKFTRVRLFIDLSTNSFMLQHWDKAGSTWITDDGATYLSDATDFGYGSVATPPANTQDALAQSPECLDDDGDAIGSSSCVVFNSRGIPIDATGAPFGNTAFYVTDGTGVYGITVSATPLVRTWWSPASHTAWMKRS
jgi:Tfp pilus assembly protein FimT